MKAKKEYDSPLPREEMVAQLRAKTKPFRLFRLNRDGWGLKEYEDGSFRVLEDTHARYPAHAILQFEATKYGTHIIAEYSEDDMLFWFVTLLLSIVAVPICIAIGVNIGKMIILVGPVFFGGTSLLNFLYCRAHKRELIKWFEADILGIKRT